MATSTETKIKRLANQLEDVETKTTAGTGRSRARFPDLYLTRRGFTNRSCDRGRHG
jgi:hypothetical protein